MKIIENNEKNSTNPISVAQAQPKGRVNQSRSNRAEYSRKEDNDLFK
jgi:hypothetical protein